MVSLLVLEMPDWHFKIPGLAIHGVPGFRWQIRISFDFPFIARDRAARLPPVMILPPVILSFLRPAS